MNSTVPQELMDEAMERDSAAAASEWLAEFRSDIESFATPEIVDAAVEAGRVNLPPRTRFEYNAFCDPAGGSGGDSMTLAISHKEDDKIIIDSILECRPPFSPESVTEEFCQLLKEYRVYSVSGDRYAGSWPEEQFTKRGISFIPCELNKPQIYLEFLALLNSGRVELPDNDKLRTQLLNLERRTTRAGRDSVDHPPGLHDDLINSVPGVAVEARTFKTDAGIFF
jgi:hypothetical protein